MLVKRHEEIMACDRWEICNMSGCRVTVMGNLEREREACACVNGTDWVLRLGNRRRFTISASPRCHYQ